MHIEWSMRLMYLKKINLVENDIKDIAYGRN